MARTLITGTRSGLGRHIYEKLGGIPWTRHSTGEGNKKILKKTSIDVIIHCAFNSKQPTHFENLYGYLRDNVLLTHELTLMPHRKFIFISTADVYPPKPILHSENEDINVGEVRSLYCLTKLMSEAVIRKHCANYLILRCVALLGKYSRKNSLVKMVKENPCTLSLSGESRLNYILHSDVSDFVKFAIKNDVCGIYNISSCENVILSEVADMLGKQINFGSYRYDVGDIDNSKIVSILPLFKKTSKEVITQFISSLQENGSAL